ncbi:hypothetical protein BT63DRAFT_425018 [Microthyrium microscopicum]|uniref:Large ribosomal subunit protein eL14 domain-containing protein n=1 Tax=Microthyrium microscopicum TaxID=703497 RepID=A0A6A6UDV8_9PEZI|nr:hypothetical protein BT63DRAFT_425018 [Microthyrium microscopicum]
MGDVTITTPRWKNVKVGRVVLFSSGTKYENRIATIVEIHDANRVVVENPSESADKLVPRHSAALAHLALTPFEIEKLPRAIGHAPLKKKWADAGVDKKWEEGAHAQSRVKSTKRRQLNDFERFKAMRARKQRTFQTKKLAAKSKA